MQWPPFFHRPGLGDIVYRYVCSPQKYLRLCATAARRLPNHSSYYQRAKPSSISHYSHGLFAQHPLGTPNAE